LHAQGLVEIAEKHELFANPRHPYTQALLASVPVADPRIKALKPMIDGDVPSPINPPSGCHLHQRCPHAIERCRIERPALVAAGDHATACHRWTELPQVKAVPSDGGHSPVLDRLIGAFAQPMDVRASTGVDTVRHGAGAAQANS